MRRSGRVTIERLKAELSEPSSLSAEELKRKEEDGKGQRADEEADAPAQDPPSEKAGEAAAQGTADDKAGGMRARNTYFILAVPSRR